MSVKRHGRHVLAAGIDNAEDDSVRIVSPEVGEWSRAPEPGALVAADQPIGILEKLGRTYSIIMPSLSGVVSYDAPQHFPRPVGIGDVLFVVQQSEQGVAFAPPSQAAGVQISGLVFCAPLAGRYYDRPAPGQPPFLSQGDKITTGTTVCLLEIMKTFTRVVYGGAGLPVNARVVEIIPVSGDDVEAGQPILHLDAS